MVAQVLHTTGAAKVAAVGYSEGATVLLASLASQRMVQDALSIAVMMAPIATLKYATSPFRFALLVSDLQVSLLSWESHHCVVGCGVQKLSIQAQASSGVAAGQCDSGAQKPLAS